MSDDTGVPRTCAVFEESSRQPKLNGDPNDFRDKFLELEYNTLRKEIETARDRHFRINAGALFIVPAAQVIVAVAESGAKGFGASLLAFAILVPLPIIVLSLYILYLSEHGATARCADYIRKYIEPFATGEGARGWESWLHENSRDYRAIETRETLALTVLYGLLYLVAAALASHQTYVMFFDIAASATVGRIAVGVAILLYATIAAYWCRSLLKHLYREMPYLDPQRHLHEER